MPIGEHGIAAAQVLRKNSAVFREPRNTTVFSDSAADLSTAFACVGHIDEWHVDVAQSRDAGVDGHPRIFPDLSQKSSTTCHSSHRPAHPCSRHGRSFAPRRPEARRSRDISIPASSPRESIHRELVGSEVRVSRVSGGQAVEPSRSTVPANLGLVAASGALQQIVVPAFDGAGDLRPVKMTDASNFRRIPYNGARVTVPSVEPSKKESVLLLGRL